MKRRHILRKYWLLSCLLMLASADPAVHAAVSERDWKDAGDGLLTFDDVNNREWLDLSETQVREFFGYDSVVAATAAGGILNGFAVAKSTDVIAFAESAGINTSTSDIGVNEANTLRLIELHGSGPPNNIFALGFVDEISPTDSERVVALFFSGSDFSGLTFETRISNPVGVGDRFLPFTGVMLFRPVPEPSTASTALFGLAFLLLAVRQRRRIAKSVS